MLIVPCWPCDVIETAPLATATTFFGPPFEPVVVLTEDEVTFALDPSCLVEHRLEQRVDAGVVLRALQDLDAGVDGGLVLVRRGVRRVAQLALREVLRLRLAELVALLDAARRRCNVASCWSVLVVGVVRLGGLAGEAGRQVARLQDDLLQLRGWRRASPRNSTSTRPPRQSGRLRRTRARGGRSGALSSPRSNGRGGARHSISREIIAGLPASTGVTDALARLDACPTRRGPPPCSTAPSGSSRAA